MSQAIEQKISVFISHFRKKVERLDTYDFHSEDRFMKKSILVSILDAISRATSNPSDKSRERFTALIKNFGQWPEHSRYSAPHVSYLLHHLRSPDFQPAREFINKCIQDNSTGELIPLSVDPDVETIRKLWPVQINEKLFGHLSLSSFSHLNLLYSHRNSLVHELREPGYGMEFHETQNEPYYHGMTTAGSDDSISENTLELVYPLKFFFLLT